jgi:hypothetical protein
MAVAGGSQAGTMYDGRRQAFAGRGAFAAWRAVKRAIKEAGNRPTPPVARPEGILGVTPRKKSILQS